MPLTWGVLDVGIKAAGQGYMNRMLCRVLFEQAASIYIFMEPGKGNVGLRLSVGVML